jgi:DNA-directed RNA polymerase subunit beta
MGKPGIPESFKVLVKELRSLGLNLKTLDKEGKEVSIDEQEKVAGRRMPQIFGKERAKSRRRI